MLDALSRTLFHSLAGSRTIEKLASRYGMSRPTSFGRRFIAGESLDEAIAAARAIQSNGMRVTLDQLGESVTTLAAADAATRVYLALISAIVASGVERNVSIKLSQLGLEIDRAVCTDNVRRILETSRPHGFFVRIDMEASPTVPMTLEILNTLWDHGYRHLGPVLQAALYRSEEDARALGAKGMRIRIVKGAYKEPKSVAHQSKADVDAAYQRIMEGLLRDGAFPAIATHDMALIEAAKRFATEHGIARDRFEFQMLYGIRRDLQATLVSEGFGMRLYVPFGKQWFPYFMRRLGERPANVGFVLRALIQDRGR
ncbi:MAG: proline dehydrogenase family protein [Planctomycetes bacterium]|nr:proline dehydrogenase family protein [Planctomycetota bacterium]